MNRIVITVTAKPGMTRQALAGLKAVTEYMSSKYDQKDQLFMQIHGTSGTFYIMNDVKDLASAQALQARIMADDAYWDMAQKFSDVLGSPPTITLLQQI